MASTSDRKIPIPISLTSTSPSLPTESQQALIRHLQETQSLGGLSSTLSDSLARSGWTDRVRALALELLRNGTCDTFPELMNEVMRGATIPKTTNGTSQSTAAGTQSNGTSTPTATQQNGTAGGMNGANSIVVAKEWSSGPDGLPDVRVPDNVVEVGVDYLKEKIRDVCEPVDDDEV